MATHIRPYMLRVKLSLEEQARLEAYGAEKVWSSSFIAREGLNKYLDEHWNETLDYEASKRLEILEAAYEAEKARKEKKKAAT